MFDKTKKTDDKVDKMMGEKHEEKMEEKEGDMKRKRTLILDSDSDSGDDSDSSSDFSVKKTPKLEDEWKTSNNQGCSQKTEESVKKKAKKATGKSEGLIEDSILKSSSQIPAPMKPKYHVLVALGVETTSLDEDCDIIQLTCSNVDQKGKDFSCYILPETKDQIKKLNKDTFEVNGLTFVDGALKQNDQKVDAVDLKEGLLALIAHLQKNTVLISHNTKEFQSTRLIRKLEQTQLTEKFSQKVVGFIDSFSLYKELWPKRPKELLSYTLKDIVEYLSSDFTKRDFEKPVEGKKNMIKIRNLAALMRGRVIPDNTELLYKHSVKVDRVIEEIKLEILHYG